MFGVRDQEKLGHWGKMFQLRQNRPQFFKIVDKDLSHEHIDVLINVTDIGVETA